MSDLDWVMFGILVGLGCLVAVKKVADWRNKRFWEQWKKKRAAEVKKYEEINNLIVNKRKVD